MRSVRHQPESRCGSVVLDVELNCAQRLLFGELRDEVKREVESRNDARLAQFGGARSEDVQSQRRSESHHYSSTWKENIMPLS